MEKKLTLTDYALCAIELQRWCISDEVYEAWKYLLLNPDKAEIRFSNLQCEWNGEDDSETRKFYIEIMMKDNGKEINAQTE